MNFRKENECQLFYALYQSGQGCKIDKKGKSLHTCIVSQQDHIEALLHYVKK